MAKNLVLKQPETPAEWQAYFQLRWRVLRAPWQQPLGSEQDDLEAQSVHLMLVSDQGEIAAVGRLHSVDSDIAQVRYMAVADAWQGKGAGAKILEGLEQHAVELGVKVVILNARETAIPFYHKLGYTDVAAAPTQFGIRHLKMQKVLMLPGEPVVWADWCQTLQQTWHNTIPLSAFMQLHIEHFDGYQLQCSAPLAPNINLHQTMFAGSIYTLATLTGWGLLYLQLQSLGLSGMQVLADASIRYFKPIRSMPQAICRMSDTRGDLRALANGLKVQQHIRVVLYCDGERCAEFNGRYAVLPE